MFSLNVDESTNYNVDRILNALVRYFDKDREKVITHHLACKKVNITTANVLMDTLRDILTSNNLQWRQVISILMDNCAVMPGKKGGLETRVKRKPFLLDKSGDTVHMMSNAAKALLSPFGTEIQDFCSDISYDIDKSPKQKEIFSEFQSLLHLPPKSLVRPISSRFLQMLDVCTRVEELIDVLVVYYYHVVPPNEEHKYRWMISQVLQRNAVSVEERPRIALLQRQQATASRAGTQANRDRKARISVLFT
ncbi:hypothetical protein AMECASPLE_007764 [Ameca splendens]|uniref:DUF4371 domain-containing protein n=1 Tax=Ameca splendens TaxID=208324 RepID=A0ABV0YZ64_9TELE